MYFVDGKLFCVFLVWDFSQVTKGPYEFLNGTISHSFFYVVSFIINELSLVRGTNSCSFLFFSVLNEIKGEIKVHINSPRTLMFLHVLVREFSHSSHS